MELVAGTLGFGDDGAYGVARFLEDGRLDTTFGQNGVFSKSIFVLPLPHFLSDMQIQKDGKIVLVGTIANDFVGVMRLDADGSLDRTFGEGGMRLFGKGESTKGYDVAIQDDGKIVVTGPITRSDGTYFSVMRLMADGSDDRSFSGGARLIYVDTTVESTTALIQPDGKIVAAGHAGSRGLSDLVVVRLNPDGSDDARFGQYAYNTLGITITYTAGSEPVQIAPEALVYDPELAALADGKGDYGGARLTLTFHDF
ncbi:MAG: hypothetical protein EOO22_08100, partial [Comamonadaceae bacterium]